MSTVYAILLTSLLIFLLAGSLLGIALGASLLARSTRAQAFLGGMNRWVSTRRMLRPVELPRETGHGGRGLGLVLVVAGAYALTVLVQIPVAKVAMAMRVGASSTLALIAIETLKWLLLAGCAASVVTGVMLLFFPHAWRAVEARANRWYSSRQLAVGGDDMHLPLDRLAQTHPRAAGGAILALSLASAVATAALLTRL
jgi:hypothetical protein